MKNLVISAGIFVVASGISYANPVEDKKIEAYVLTYPIFTNGLTLKEIEAKKAKEAERQQEEMTRYCDGKGKTILPPIFTIRF